MRFLICGLGSIGRRHLRNLQQMDQQDLALFRSGHSTLPEDELTGIQSFADLDGALRAFEPDAVIVANPTALHLPVAIAAAAAGCHLLLEKPVSHSLERIDELQDALRVGGGKVLVGYQFRFNQGLREILRLLESGRLGRALYGRAHWGEYLPDWHPWEDYRDGYSARADLGGGVLLTLSHPFDYLAWMLGEVESVAATTSHTGGLEIDVETLAEATLNHAGGAISSVHLDYLERPPRHTLTIVCTGGIIEWSAETSDVKWRAAEGGEQHEALAPPGYSRNAMFTDEMRHFLDVVAGSAEPSCGLADGVRALAVALAASESAVRGLRVGVGSATGIEAQ